MRDLGLSDRPLIAIVAGEVSGDILGAGLIKAIKQIYPNAHFIGIAGPQMQAQGMPTLFEMERLSIMGLVEVIKHLPQILSLKKQLIQQLLGAKPDIFIGIDAPDFNLRVEKELKGNGIKTIHYVSPSVWAWRQKRIFTIAKATNLVLAFLPFEKAFYDRFSVPCRFIGHKMADDIPLEIDKSTVYTQLHLDENQRYVTIMPGSRRSEIEFLGEVFLKTALLLKQKYPDIHFLVPLINAERRKQFEQIKATVAPDLSMTLLDGQARQAMMIAKATLLASGTAALEAMLCKSPMVVAYRMKPLTYWLAKRLVKTPYISLPNLLANEALVPELIQDECHPQQLAEALDHYLKSDIATQSVVTQLKARFLQLHQLIRCDADKQAAQAIKDVLNGNI